MYAIRSRVIPRESPHNFSFSPSPPVFTHPLPDDATAFSLSLGKVRFPSEFGPTTPSPNELLGSSKIALNSMPPNNVRITNLKIVEWRGASRDDISTETVDHFRLGRLVCCVEGFEEEVEARRELSGIQCSCVPGFGSGEGVCEVTCRNTGDQRLHQDGCQRER